MSLFRQVLQQLLWHDQDHTKELFSLNKISLCVCVYADDPRSYFIINSTFFNAYFPRYSIALQLSTTPAQHLDSTWSSPLNISSASATTSGQTSCIFNLPPFSFVCRSSITCFWFNNHVPHLESSTPNVLSPPRYVHFTMLFSPMRYAFFGGMSPFSPCLIAY
ncbi:hypothetical protein DY000_02022614 [Brassica cretica]|uniref:Uncharacterized protein n=1 Tax=Brassica cretica TaxID=69181 RepID=A0ABQ7E6B7_BRACR|nr:hypothetical protein DY000_02022614 [Brassica cretica]